MAVASVEQAGAKRVGEVEHQFGGISCPTSTGEISYQRGERRLVLKPGSAAYKDHGASELKPTLLRRVFYAARESPSLKREEVA